MKTWGKYIQQMRRAYRINQKQLSLGTTDFFALDEKSRWCFACNLIRDLCPEIGIIVKTFPLKYSVSECIQFPCVQRQICVSDHSIITCIKEYKEVSCNESGFGLIPS